MIFISILLIFLSILFGLILGKVKFYRFKLGISGTIFASLILSWFSKKFFNVPISSLNQEFNVYFKFSLILFISSVGLIASKKIKETFRKLGIKFAFLGFLTTFIGFLTTYLLSFAFKKDTYKFIGLFSGALTSSPGLATALENSIKDSEIIYGYSLGYLPGVFTVIIILTIITQIYNNIDKQKISLKNDSKINKNNNPFDFLSFSIVIVLGILIGKLKLNFGIFSFSLEMTGGILISALLLGSLKKIWKLSFQFDDSILKAIQNLGLMIFLASIGLKSGHEIITTINLNILYLMSLSILIASISMITSFYIGKYLLKIDKNLLIGAITGGMTSTPGLATAIDLTKSDEVILGYGSTYPFALLGMVIFNKILLVLLT